VASKRDSWLSDQVTKSAFFHQRLHEWGLLEVADDLEQVKGQDLEWSREDLGITENAWNKVIHNGIKPVRVFAHPAVLNQDSRRVSYYRMLSMVSQKSMGNMGLSVASYECDSKILKDDHSIKIARHLNSIICMLIESDESVNEREFDIWRGMAAGSQAQGSWLNDKGDTAEGMIKWLISKRLTERKILAHESSQGKNKELKLEDGRVIIMGKEPDVAIKKGDRILVAIEIKGGIDTAGALERFGAALKSLNRAKQENLDSITVLIVHEASVTDTANREIDGSKSIDYLFTIGCLVSEEANRDKFFKVMGI